MNILDILLYIALPLGGVGGGLGLLFYRHQRLLQERAEAMVAAVRHRDFTFRLPRRGAFFGERALQDALSEMGQEVRKIEARQEVESWQKLTRVLTHEIMNATAPIQSICQAYLASDGIAGTPYEEGLRTIHDTSRSLATFVENYRKIAQLQNVQIGTLRLREFIDSITLLYPDIQWRIEVPDDLTIQADENLLRMVFINLVKNALEADARSIGIKHHRTLLNPPLKGGLHKKLPPLRGTEGVRTEGVRGFGLLQVSNDGQPIPDEVATEIFVPFFTTKRRGSGIGLALARQVLMLQGMTLSLRQRPIYGYNVTFEIEA